MVLEGRLLNPWRLFSMVLEWWCFEFQLWGISSAWIFIWQGFRFLKLFSFGSLSCTLVFHLGFLVYHWVWHAGFVISYRMFWTWVYDILLLAYQNWCEKVVFEKVQKNSFNYFYYCLFIKAFIEYYHTQF